MAHLHGICTFLLICLFYLSQCPQLWGPPPCSLTESPWTVILHHQSHSSVHSFVHSFIHSFIHLLIHIRLLESSKRSPPTYGEKHKVIIHGAPCRQKTYIQWGAAWFPKGIFKDQTVQEQCTPLFPTLFLDSLTPDDRTKQLSQNISQ